MLQGGGILRCRPDGRDLHIFATGLRNIYDVALDAELDVELEPLSTSDVGEGSFRFRYLLPMAVEAQFYASLL